MLRLNELTAQYGRSKALFGMSFSIEEGETVALVGRNGMGKTTTIRAIMGIPPAERGGGTVEYKGQRIDQWPSFEIARLGISIVPEGRHVFPLLSVRENLIATSRGRESRLKAWGLDEVYSLFPRLRARAGQSAATLSGGEQQMLAIGRALMTNPMLLFLDEATEGLAPIVRDEIWQALIALRNTGMSMLIVDKNVEDLAVVTDRFLVVEKGEIVASFASALVKSDVTVLDRYLSV
jgi:branched-chain amino acid transport system ATP-binding protein